MRTMLAMAIAAVMGLGALSASAATATSGHAIATFAGGCFWAAGGIGGWRNYGATPPRAASDGTTDADACPVARTLGACIAITTELTPTDT